MMQHQSLVNYRIFRNFQHISAIVYVVAEHALNPMWS